MEFAVLGLLHVSVAGEAVTIGARKRQLVLAVLLARAGQPVPTDALVDAVWGDRPPNSARRNLQLYVHQLRRILGDRVIAARGDGYAIEPGDGLDAIRFRRLASEGAARLDAGDLATAAQVLRAALDLWRGQAFTDFLDCQLVADEALRLELLRLETYERWAEAQLVSGATSQLFAELSELSRSHPYRESLHALLMRALYQTGRQAEALAVFREARARLVDDLGVEPGPALRRLHEAMLRGDEALLPVPSTAPAPLPRPRQLPAPPQLFTGRVGELAALERVQDAPAVVISAIGGMAGVGKTALAVHAAHRIANRYRDGQLFVDLHGYTEGVAPVEPAEALDRMLRALGVPGKQVPAGLDERAAVYRSLLADKQVLIVLDNAATESQVAPLLPGAAGCLVLVTSRRRLAGLDRTHALSLDSLPAPDAVTLLFQTAGEGRLAGEPPDLVAELVELCGRLPLAIRIAAARLRSHPAWRLSLLVERLRDRHRLSELEAGRRSVAAALDLSYQDLTADQRRTYRLLGVHPGPDIDAYATAALLDSTLRHAARMLDQLFEANLLLEPVPGRYRFHDLTRAHAARTATDDRTEPGSGAALDRLLDYYRHAASRAMDAGYPYEREERPLVPPAHTAAPDLPDRDAALAWLDTELPNLLAAARYATDNGLPEHVLQLSSILHRHLRTRSRYQDAETLHHQALATAGTVDHQVGQLDALNNLGHIHLQHERHEEATDRYRQAVRIARAIGHPTGELAALAGLGHIQLRQGRYAEAIEYLEQSLQLARATGHRPTEALALTGLGQVYLREGRYAEASDHYQQLLAVARETGDRNAEFEAWQGLGWLRRANGSPHAAVAHHHRALALARELNQPGDRARAHDGLARAHSALDQHDQAHTQWRHALDILTSLGVDRTDVEETTVAAIRAELAGADQYGNPR